MNEITEKEDLIIKTWNDLKYKPKCIIFDLDYTLWPFIIDHQLLPPIKKVIKNDKQILYDHNNKLINHYEDVSIIIKTLKTSCFTNDEKLAIASRATAQQQALELIDLFGWMPYLNSIQIYSGIKRKHLNSIKQELKLSSYNHILFFDDSKLNLQQTVSLGVFGHQVKRHYGLNINELINGLKNFDSNFKTI